MRWPFLSGPVLAGDKHVAIREYFERLRRLAKIRGEHVLGICRNPIVIGLRAAPLPTFSIE
jgi:hypothetical protein